jgi:hypothetical protein
MGDLRIENGRFRGLVETEIMRAPHLLTLPCLSSIIHISEVIGIRSRDRALKSPIAIIYGRRFELSLQPYRKSKIR